jgi:hypothetical protein
MLSLSMLQRPIFCVVLKNVRSHNSAAYGDRGRCGALRRVPAGAPPLRNEDRSYDFRSRWADYTPLSLKGEGKRQHALRIASGRG